MLIKIKYYSIFYLKHFDYKKVKYYKNQQIYQDIISCGLLNGDEIIFTKDLENSKLQALIEIIQNKPDILLYFLKNHAYPSDKEIIKEWFAKDDNQTKYKFLYFTIQSQE